MNTKAVAVCDVSRTETFLPLRALMEAVAQAAHDQQAGKICAPTRQAVPFPGGSVMLSMPATAADLEIHKLVNIVPSNRAAGLPVINGLVAVYEGTTGQLRLLLDGPTVTSRRTAAVSMAALSRFRPAGPRHVTVIGTGAQADGHVRALRELYPHARIDIVGRSFAKAQEFTRTRTGIELRPAPGVHPQADLVITATGGMALVYDEPPRADRLIIAIGAYRADLAEIGPRTLAGSRLYVDYPDAARHEAGDYLQAGVDWSTVLPLTHLLDNPPYPGPAVFKSVGCAAWDLAAARCALQIWQIR